MLNPHNVFVVVMVILYNIQVWKDALALDMEKAGREEKKRAIEAGNVDADQIPFITVYLDGGWSKRSYGHSYNAMSGAVSICAIFRCIYISNRIYR